MPKQYYDAATYRARDSIGYLVKRVSALMLDYVESSFASHGFTFTQWQVLMYLRDGLSITPADMCRQMRHDSGALTRVIDQLEERGLIKRQRSSQDRRVVELELTRLGRKTVNALVPITVDALNDALSVFSIAEADQLKELLRRMLGHLESKSKGGSDAASQAK